jgi:large subunit ribosomal protein L38
MIFFSNLERESSELLHYAVSNITSESISDGIEWCPYLPPIPLKGTGYHRLVVNLYHQKKKVEIVNKIENLKQRTFSSFQYYQKFEENLTPAAFRFCQGNSRI